MRSVLNALTGRWFLSLIGALILCALIWFIGPLIAIGEARPLDNIVVQAAAMVIILLLWLIYVLLGRRREAKQEQSIVNAVAGTGKGAGGDDAAQAISAEQAAVGQKLQAVLADLKTVKTADGRPLKLAEFPWYAIIGPPGAGKTTALLNSGLRFPLAERHGAQALKGVGGTRNCDWWFTDQAVILDTAGRYTTQDSDSAVDMAGWRNFLNILKQNRPSQPLNGVFAVFGVPDLLAMPAEERRTHARAVRTRLIELQEAFGIRLPVYVVMTKLDLVSGFTEFFDDLDRDGREQVWGFTFPLDRGGPQGGPHAKFLEEFDALMGRLEQRQIDRLQNERDQARRASIFGFPGQFASLRPVLDDILREAFDDSRFAARPILRGVYFTSATQEGTPIDRLMGVIAAKFGIHRAQMPPQVGTGRGFFLKRLFENVVFAEGGLVGANPVVVRRRATMRRAAFAGIGAVTLGGLGLWGWSFMDNRALIDKVAEETQKVEPRIEQAQRLPLGDGSPAQIVQQVLPLLNELRVLPAGFAQQTSGEAAALGYGLYQGDRLGVHTGAIYRRALNGLLLPRLLVRLQNQLSARLVDPEYAFLALKAYLMLGDPSRLQPAYIANWFAEDWQNLQLPDREALMGHLAALTAEPWAEVGLDQGLVAEARNTIARLPPAQRAFRVLVEGREARGLPQWRINDQAGPQAAQGLVRRSGRPLTEGVHGLYTRRGYYSVVANPVALERVLRETAADAWVVSDDPQAGGIGDTRQLGAEVITLYLQNYIRVWEELIADIGLPQLREPRQTADVLIILSGPNSPFARLYNAVATETRLAEGLAAPTGTGPAAVAAQAAFAAQRTMLERLGGGRNPAEIVDARFKWLHDFVGPAGQPGPMADFLKRLEDLGRQAGALAVAGAGGPGGAAGGGGGGAANVAQIAGQLAIEAGRLPGPVAEMARTLAEGTARVGGSAARTQISQAWQADVARFCAQATANRFPFIRNAEAEIPLDDFGRLFGPGQLIDQFFNNNLRTIVDSSRTPWRMVQGAPVQISDAALANFQRAAAIRDAFFPPGSPTPATGFNLQLAAPLQGLRKATIEIDGQVMAAEGAATPAAAMQWPRGVGGARVILEPATGAAPSTMQYPGAWALFRLFQEGRPVRRAADRFALTFTAGDGSALYEITARSVRNPFLLPDLAAFRCPQL